MIPQRLAYTAREVRRLLGVTDRTLRRWRREGKHFHPWRDPEDPHERWFYDVEEVDAYRRKHRRGSGTYKLDVPGREVPVKPWTLEPTLPGPVAGRVYARLKRGEAIDDICDAEGVAPEQVIRLEQLRRDFESERARAPAVGRARATSSPRLVTDERDPAIAAIARELDADRQRQPSSDSDGATNGQDGESGPDLADAEPRSGGPKR